MKTVAALLLAVVALAPAAGLATASSPGVTYATVELSPFTNHLVPGSVVSVTTEFIADGETYGYWRGSNTYTVPACGCLTVHLDLTDVKGGEEYESGQVIGWFTTDYMNPVIRTDGAQALFVSYVN